MRQVSLSAIVLDVGGQPTLLAAIRSLLTQEPRPQIVVVSSGGGDASAQIRAAGLPVDVVTSSVTLLPGAARNLGIAATSGSHVAFLAADCIAAPGWAAGRIDAHARGARIVSSAVVNDRPRNPFATAGHTLLFPTRLPGTPPERRLHYGASYDRSLVEQHGRFRDDLRVGEDTELHERVATIARPVFRPDVLVAHRNPRTPRELLVDHFHRGGRAAAARVHLYGERAALARRRVALNAISRVRRSVSLAWISLPPRERVGLLVAAPFLLPAAAAYSAGAALGATGVTQPGQAAATQRHIRLVGLVAFRNERRHLADMLANVSPHLDAIVALDDGSTDGSTEIAAGHPNVIELIRFDSGGDHRWDERRNKRILVDAAIRHGAQWAMAIDADERLEREFRRRADRTIDAADATGIGAFYVRVRELWDSDGAYRADGLWGGKLSARLFRVPNVYDAGEMELHGAWAPPATRLPNGGWRTADLELYHLATLRPEDRAARRAKYERLDPNRRWQQIGYQYMTDETGLELVHVPSERDYRSQLA